jgi:hypothetical protein
MILDADLSGHLRIAKFEALASGRESSSMGRGSSSTMKRCGPEHDRCSSHDFHGCSVSG